MSVVKYYACFGALCFRLYMNIGKRYLTWHEYLRKPHMRSTTLAVRLAASLATWMQNGVWNVLQTF